MFAHLHAVCEAVNCAGMTSLEAATELQADSFEAISVKTPAALRELYVMPLSR